MLQINTWMSTNQTLYLSVNVKFRSQIDKQWDGMTSDLFPIDLQMCRLDQCQVNLNVSVDWDDILDFIFSLSEWPSSSGTKESQIIC